MRGYKSLAALVAAVVCMGYALPHAAACPVVRKTAQIDVKHNVTKATIIQDSVSLHMVLAPIPILHAVGHTCQSFTPAFKPVPGCYQPAVIRNRWPAYLEAHKTNTYVYTTDTTRWVRVTSAIRGYPSGVFVPVSKCEMDAISSQLYHCILTVK